MITYPECTADVVTALCDKQVMAVRSFCTEHAYQHWSAIDQK